MNKLAQYLNQHLAGDVVTQQAILRKYATDRGPLTIQPDMVAFPRTTNDIRKLLRFSWQLAEKNYSLSVTPRGSGTSVNGGALGSGIVVDMSRYMNTIYEVDSKQSLIRLQPGATAANVATAMALHSLSAPYYEEASESTIGGIVADSHETTGEPWIDQLEVVLANGDVMQTKRLSKREFNRKKGEQGFEADIYRGIDTLIEDHKDLIDQLDTRSGAGYAAIGQVKRRDGSFDLTPLFCASQGTLGIMSEMIISGQPGVADTSFVIIGFDKAAAARDALDDLAKIKFRRVEYFDKTMIARAHEHGKSFDFVAEEGSLPEAILLLWLDDSASRARTKKQKKLTKILSNYSAKIVATDNLSDSDYSGVLALKTLGLLPSNNSESPISLANGIVIVLEQVETFRTGVAKLAAKHHLELSLYGRPFENIWSVATTINTSSVGGKRTMLTLLDELASLTAQCGGFLSGEYGEGRLQCYSVHRAFDKEVQELYAKIRAIFDPHGMLNTGVKQPIDIKDLARLLHK